MRWPDACPYRKALVSLRNRKVAKAYCYDLGKIAVIREEDNTRRVYTIDIRNSDLFNSPAYYLAQNDIVYIRPKKPKSEEKANFIQWLTLALSVATATSSIIWVTR